MAFDIWRWAVDPPSTGCDFHTPRCTFDVHYRPFTNHCLNLTLCAVDSPTGLLYPRLSDSARRTFYRFDEGMALEITIHVPLESPLWNPPPRGYYWGSVKVYECAIISSRVVSYYHPSICVYMCPHPDLRPFGLSGSAGLMPTRYSCFYSSALSVGNGISLLALCLYSTVISLLSLLIREKDSCSPVIRLWSSV